MRSKALLVGALVFLCLNTGCKTLPQNVDSQLSLDDRTQVYISQYDRAMNKLKAMEAEARQRMAAAINSADAAAINKRMAEWLSIRHQQDNVRYTDPSIADNVTLAREMGLSPERYGAMLDGIIDSDQGKIKERLALLTSNTPESNRLFDVLRLEGVRPIEQIRTDWPNVRSAAEVLAYVTDGVPVQNSATDNNTLRSNLGPDGLAAGPGYLHDLPGIYDAIADYDTGKISAELLDERLRSNINHNGPDAGFWNFLKKIAFPAAKQEMVRQVFEGTIYDGKAPGESFSVDKLAYPDPYGVSGFWHRLADRISQATRGGSAKIFYEVRFKPMVALLAELIVKNPVQTQEQLEVSRQGIEASKNLSETERTALLEKNAEAMERVRSISQEVQSRIVNIDEVRAVFDGTPEEQAQKQKTMKVEIVGPDGQTRTFTSEQAGGVYAGEGLMEDLRSAAATDPVAKQLLDHFSNPANVDPVISNYDAMVVDVEKKIGDPMRPQSDAGKRAKQANDVTRKFADPDLDRANQAAETDRLANSSLFDPRVATALTEVKAWKSVDLIRLVSQDVGRTENEVRQAVEDLEKSVADLERAQELAKTNANFAEQARQIEGRVQDIQGRYKAVFERFRIRTRGR